MNRKKFLQLSTASASAFALSPSAAFEQKSTTMEPNKSFQLKIFATDWGFQGSIDEFCKKAKAAGYNGIETVFPADKAKQEQLLTAIRASKLEAAYLVRGYHRNWADHLAEFKKNIDEAIATKPVYINCHTGKDIFSFDQNRPFVEHGLNLSAKMNIPVYSETHRSRMLYSAIAAREYFDKIKDLKITLDVSHWCNVHESLLEDQEEIMQLAIERTGHVHARVGHQEGPQVTDPRAPEWKTQTEAHFAWWDKIVANKKNTGDTLTVLTEFGPPHYMPTIPYSDKPVANQWEINAYMLKTLRERYSG